MIIKLKGKLSYIDKNGKLHFAWTHEPNEKLIKHCSSGDIKPYTDDEFTVLLPSTMRRAGKAPPDILALTGIDCKVYVKLQRYDFTSTLKRNFGENVNGTSLILQNIIKNLNLNS